MRKRFELYLGTAVVFLLVFCVYGSTRSSLFNIDGMGYANVICRAESLPLSSANHLLYPAVGYSVSRALHADALATLQWLNVLAGALGAALMVVLASRLLPISHKMAAGLGLGLATSYGYWLHGTDAEDMMIGTVLMLLGVLVFVWKKQTITIPQAILCGIFTALAALFHANLILIGIPLLVWLFFQPNMKKGAAASAFCLTVFSMLAIPVGILALAYPQTLAERLGGQLMAQWDVWGAFSLKELARSGYGGVKSFLGFPILYERLSIFLREAQLFEKVLWLAAMAGMVLLMLGLLIFGIRGALKHLNILKPVAWLLGLWILIHGSVAVFWAPGDVEFWVPVLTAFWLLLGWLALLGGRKGAVCLGSLVVLLFVCNATFSFYPASNPNNNTHLQLAKALHKQSEPGDLIVTPGADWISTYVAYFSQREVLDLEVELYRHGSLEQVGVIAKQQMDTTLEHGNRVWVGSLYGKAADENPAWEFLRPLGLTPETLRGFFALYPRYETIQIHDRRFRVIEKQE
ncbi:hypothetical protein GF373_08705 [bacterium]|nr:hypothetical protein [bacterium]